MRRAQHEGSDGEQPGHTGADSLIAQLVLDHLYRLTDSTGIFQHAKGSRPNPEFGYCLDDNARALIVAIRAHALTGDNGLLDYIRHYLAFVERCQRADGRFHNFMSAGGAWLDETGSEDSHGRAVWALGFAARHSAQMEVRVRALHGLDASLGWLEGLTFLRAKTFALLGLGHWRAAEPSPRLDAIAEGFATDLAEAYERTAQPGWHWFEDSLTYCNARLPEALIGTAWDAAGLESLAWLCEVMEVDGVCSLIGNRGWYQRGGQRAVFDQQPVDACALISACCAACRQSGDDRFRRWADLAYGWFLGKNPGGRPMIDPDTGGCFDGLEEDGVNGNQGAESLLAWLLAQEDMLEIAPTR